MKVIAILFLLITVTLLPGIVSQDTSAILVDTETSTGNCLTAWIQEGAVAKFFVADDGTGGHGGCGDCDGYDGCGDCDEYDECGDCDGHDGCGDCDGHDGCGRCGCPHGDYIYEYAADGAYVGRFQLSPENDRPQGVATVGTDIYVLDHVDDQVYHYTITGDSSGELLSVSRVLRDFSGRNVNNPSAMAIDGDEMWIVEQGGGHGDNGGILRYSLSAAFDSGEPINALQEISLAHGNTNAEGLAISAEHLYVADASDNRFYLYLRSGDFVKKSKELKQVNGHKIKKPTGAMYDGTSLWIVDQQLNMVLEYDVSSLFSGQGSLNAISQFDLHSDNTKADGL